MTLRPDEKDMFRRFIRDPEPEFRGWVQRIAGQSIAYANISGAPQIRSLLRKITGSSHKINYGRDTATFSTSSISDLKTVNHGLGVTPACVILTGEDSGTSVIAGAVYTTNSTSFTCKFRDVDGATRGPGDLAFNWIAIG